LGYLFMPKTLTALQKVLDLHNYGNSCINDCLGIVSEMLYDLRLPVPTYPCNENLTRGNE
ncbi:hypothetical protein, partial [Sphaerochaeta sp. UBA5836]|uniref:hypothetical protein n=1 Tax=Sphaerochaeta sp. UBA5836 TaxID=1947474 RepID=UPI0025CF7B9B